MSEEQIIERLMRHYQQLLDEGKLPSLQQLEGYYRLFRQNFGPDALASMDGEELLNKMHEFNNRDSLVYWLEFKNDAEFPTRIFGSIAGGSAMKYGLFRKKETGTWTTGPSHKPIEVSIEAAVGIARKHRDQLIKGVSIIESIPDSTKDDVYIRLQQGLASEAPDVQNTAWGHKYFHLMCPDKLDDWHMPIMQRFFLSNCYRLHPNWRADTFALDASLIWRSGSICR